jgi:hypothetical protein
MSSGPDPLSQKQKSRMKSLLRLRKVLVILRDIVPRFILGAAELLGSLLQSATNHTNSAAKQLIFSGGGFARLRRANGEHALR